MVVGAIVVVLIGGCVVVGAGVVCVTAKIKLHEQMSPWTEVTK